MAKKITWEDKEHILPYGTRENQVWDLDLNEIKTVVNANADSLAGLEGGYQGVLLIADTPVNDGYYLAGESGTYTNAGGLVVDLTDTITFINKVGAVYTKTEIPLTVPTLNTGTLNPASTTYAETGKTIADYVATLRGGIVASGETKDVSGGKVYDAIELEKNDRIYEDYLLKQQIEGINTNNLGHLAIADIPIQDGVYIASESGTYVNCNNLVVNLSNKIVYISVTNSQTEFTLIEIPISSNEIYVEDFGAVGDGITDDALAIQSAVDYGFNNGGAVINFKAKPYKIFSSIRLKDGVSFRGVPPKFNYGANCPDLNFTIVGGSRLVAGNSGLTGLIANETDGGVIDSTTALSNVVLDNIGLKGFKKAIKIGAVNKLGMGMGGFRSVFVDGTAEDNLTVVTQTAIELWNCQQMYNEDVLLYKVRNGLKIYNDKDNVNCSSGNSVWNKFYCYMDTSTTSEKLSNITGITTGTTTTITTDVAHELSEGDVCQLNGVTGTNGDVLNRVLKVDTVISTTSFTVDVITTGKTITATGTCDKGRVGLHLVAKDGEPLNHVSFYAPQINCFLADYQNKAVCNIAICGAGTGVVGANLIHYSDTEGKTDHHIYLDGTSNVTLNIATIINEPVLGHLAIYNSSSPQIQCSDIDITVKFGDKRVIDSNSAITFNGNIKSFIANSYYPSFGIYNNAFDSSTSYSGTKDVRSLEYSDISRTIGSSLSAYDTWIPLRLISKRETVKFSGGGTLSIDRVGYAECTNTSDSIIVLPKIGTGIKEARVGVPFCANKFSGGGNVTIKPATGQTIGGLSEYKLSSAIGSSVFLIASGFSDWVIVGESEYRNNQIYFADAAILNWDLGFNKNIKVQAQLSVGNSRSLPNSVISTGLNGKTYRMMFLQDSIGGRGITFDTNYVVTGALNLTQNSLNMIDLTIQDGKGYVKIS